MRLENPSDFFIALQDLLAHRFVIVDDLVRLTSCRGAIRKLGRCVEVSYFMLKSMRERVMAQVVHKRSKSHELHILVAELHASVL
ncbi:hypothetical protein DP42_4658 [Burkholderia pseudomallei]|nr:hypothetical protein DO73_3484 [Burkholderia pseudomallei]KGD19546.1 hypothetical protein DP42_4658 [Burkholderia pseudomallei]OMW54102.1 hypothetical protein AQ811_06270 [Burkholderia pseudomallei]